MGNIKSNRMKTANHTEYIDKIIPIIYFKGYEIVKLQA